MEYPIYKKVYGNQWFKMVSEKSVLSIRDDETVSGYGFSDLLPDYQINSIISFEDSTEEEFKEAFSVVDNKVNPYKP